MNFKRLAIRTEKHEGFSALPYKDSEGYWTIGIGNRYIDGKEVTEHTPAVTYKQALQEMYGDLFGACIDAQLYAPNLDMMPPIVQEVVTELTYQLGLGEICKFVKMRQALEQGDYRKAAKELRNSLLYRQAKNRTEELALLLEGA